jgi:hypothetical protein
MPKFKVGDRVERIDPLVPPYMHIGVITRVIPATNGPDWVTEYDVDFGNQVIATLYETQLGLAKSP